MIRQVWPPPRRRQNWRATVVEILAAVVAVGIVGAVVYAIAHLAIRSR